MGEALGIDLRAGAVAAVRWRDGRAEACELGDGPWDGPVDVTADLLGEVARRAGRGPDEPVGVTHHLAPDDEARRAVEQAAAAAFGRALVVGRPLATAAFAAPAGGGGERVLAVLEVTGTAVECALVRVDRTGVALVAPPAVRPEAGLEDDVTRHLDGAVALLDGLLAGVGGGPAVDRVVVAGASPWLDQLALQVRLGTGLTVDLPPAPATAAAAGAALLAAEPDRRGPAAVAAAAGLGAAAVVAGVGDGAGPQGAAGEGVGAALGEAATAADAVGRALGEAGAAVGEKAGAAADAAGDVAGQALGAVGTDPSGPGDGPSPKLKEDGASPKPKELGAADDAVGRALGAAARRARATGRGKVVAAGLAAAAGALVIIGALGAGGGASGPRDDVETAADPAPDRPATTRVRTTGTPSTTVAAPASTTVPAGVPAPTTTVARGEPAGGGTGGPSAGTDPGGGGGAPTPTPGPTTAEPGSTAPPGTTAPPPDTTGPALELTTNRSTIQEYIWEFCEVDTTAILSVRATDPSGVASVTGSWSGGGTSDALTFQPVGGGTWQATLQVEGAPITSGQQAALTWSATATDGVGNASSATGPPITLLGC